jgi:hypothetical protein
MPEVVTCPSCERKLRLPDDLLGQEVKCPTCGTTFLGEVSRPKPPVAEKKPEEDNEPTYRLESKRRSRRSRDDEDDDRPSRRRSRRDDDDDDDDDRPSRRRRRRYDDDDDPWARRRYLTPHRGATVLTVGILGIVVSLLCCPVGLVMGIIAVCQGSNDLAAMNRGDMDPSGRGSTLAGLICGVITIILAVLVLVVSMINGMSD